MQSSMFPGGRFIHTWLGCAKRISATGTNDSLEVGGS